MSNETGQSQIEGLATLLVLDDEIKRLANLREFGFFSTNETHRLIGYHTAYLWQSKDFIGVRLIAQSGTAELDAQAPTNQWLTHKIQFIIENPTAKQSQQFTLADLNLNSDTTESNWPENLPENLLWCPFLDKSNNISGGLIFFRDTPFTDSEIRMLRWLIASYQYTWNVLIKPKAVNHFQLLRKKPYFTAATILLLAIIFFPVRLSVLANSTVIPKDPVLVNAPMQGVIKSFSVTPGSVVQPGQVLLVMDKTDLNASVEVDQRNYFLTEAKLRTAINEAFNDKEKRAEVPILEAQLAIDKAHLDYTNTLLSNTEIKSTIAGIVIFDSKEDWVGQPVQTGERILVVANPNSVKLRITLPVADSISLKIGASGNFFLYGQLHAIAVKITSLGYNAKLMPNRILAYQLEAEFVNQDTPQIGSQGTVKLYGQRVPLIYYLIRKPLQSIRQTIGI